MRTAFRGVQVAPESITKDQLHQVDTFAGGFNASDAPEDLQPGASPDMLDAEISHDDRLVRAPGVTQVEALDHAPTQVILHPGYHYSSSLIFLAPPWIGMKGNGATTWSNLGLAAGPYGWTDFAGVLLLSNGVKGTYWHEPGKLKSALPTDLVQVDLIPGSPAALSLATFANRVVLGSTTVDGEMDLMGVGWSDASSDYKGWSLDDGAGSMSLIGSMRRADRIQNLVALGFDMLAVVARRSLWRGQRTGDVDEPIDFAPRLEDTGASHAATVLPTEYGAVFLSDDGVRIFTGNDAPVISEAINPLLLPVRESDPYTAGINPQKKRYYLHTPSVTWVYDLGAKRWYRWAATFLASVWFPDQGLSGPTWDTIGGTWDSQTLAWWQLDPQESNGEMHFVRGALLGKQDAAATGAFGVALTPQWHDRRVLGEHQDMLFTHLEAYLTYESEASAQIEIWLPGFKGDYERVGQWTLPSSASKTARIALPFIHTGRGVGLGIRMLSGAPRVRKASVRYQVTSQL